MPGFYKKDINQLLYASQYIRGEGYFLDIKDKDTYTFPFHGWYWFETESEARTFFGMPALATPIVIPNYLKFWDDLLISSVYQSIREKAVNSLEVTVACTEFVAAIGDAKLGRPNHDAIQACIYNLLIASNFNQTELDGLQVLMNSNNLHYYYTLSLPTP